MPIHKIIFLVIITVCVNCYAQSDTALSYSVRPFKLTDTSVVSGQYYRLFDLSFSGVDTLRTVNYDKRLDSLILFLNTQKVGNVMIVYCHYSAKGSVDYDCIKQSWNKADAITRYLRKKLSTTHAFSKTVCYKPDIKKKVKVTRGAKNTDEFAEIMIINR